MSVLFPHKRPAAVPYTARQAFERDLVGFGVDAGTAQAVARGVVEPRAARAGLRNPTRHRVDGGALVALPTHIYPWASVVAPDNPRTAADADLPAAGGAGIAPPRPVNRPGGGLLLDVASPAHIVDIVNRSSSKLLALGEWNESIAESGVLQSITVVPVEIVHDDGTAPVIVLMSEDGATRLANAQHNSRLAAAWDIIYDFTRPGSTRGRNFIADIIRLLDSNTPESISDEDKARLRSSVIPVSIILGFEPDDPDNGVGLVEALNSYKGQLHIAPPEPWPTGAQRDEQLLEALAALYPLGSLAYEWRAGRLTPDTATEAGFSSNIDDIALAVFIDLAPYHYDVNLAIRRLNAGRPVFLKNRLAVAAESGVRLARAGVPQRVLAIRRGVVEVITTVVTELIDSNRAARLGDGAAGWTWTSLSPDELHENAVREFDERLEESPHRIELLARGALHLALRDSLVSATRGGELDRRSLAEILKEAASSKWGLRVLHEGLVAGRALRDPMRVDADGSPMQNANGVVERIRDEWIRSTVVPKVTPPSGNGNTQVRTATERYEMRVDAVADAIEALKSAIEVVKEFQDENRTLMWRDRGVTPPIRAERMLEVLSSVNRDIQQLQFVGEQYTERFGATADDAAADEGPAAEGTAS